MNFGKANWELFRENLTKKAENFEIPVNISDFNKKITLEILDSSKLSIPLIKKFNFKQSFPPEIIQIIKERRKIRKEIQIQKKAKK
jgi:hypothetical protein